jgi:hypothetical protein
VNGRNILALGAAIAACAAAPVAAQQVGHARTVIALNEEVLELRFADADLDGMLDAWIAVREASGGRALLLYRQRDGRVFPSQPDERIAVRKPVVAWCVGKFTAGTAQAEVLFLVRDGAYLRSADGSVKRVAPGRMLLDMPAEDSLPYWPYCGDADGDGLDEILLVEEDGFRVFSTAGVLRGEVLLDSTDERSPAAERAFFSGNVRASLSSQELSDLFVPDDDVAVIEAPPALFTSVRIPAPAWADANGDGRDDLTYLRGGILLVHLQGADGSFPAEPSVGLDLKAGDAEDDDLLQWTDLDGDAAADLLQVRDGGSSGASFSSDWQVRVWSDPLRGATLPEAVEGAAPPPAWLRRPGAPTGFVKLATARVGVYLLDMDGDGRKDLGISGWDLDVSLLGDAGSQLVHTTSGYLAQPEGGFAARPAFAEVREYDLSDLDSFHDVPAFSADLDGDGRADLIESSGAGNVEVRPIVARSGSWAPAAEAAFRVPVDALAARMIMLDLNGDRVDDFAVSRLGQIEVYLSQRR